MRPTTSVLHSGFFLRIKILKLTCCFQFIKFGNTFHRIFSVLWKYNHVINLHTHIAKISFCFRCKLIAHFFYYQKHPLNSIHQKHNYKHLLLKPFKTIFVLQPLIIVVCCTLTYTAVPNGHIVTFSSIITIYIKSAIKASKVQHIHCVMHLTDVHYIPTHRKLPRWADYLKG